MTFAEELRSWRHKCQLTQEGAADYLNVRRRTYQEWEQGRQEPDQKGPIRVLMNLWRPT